MKNSSQSCNEYHIRTATPAFRMLLPLMMLVFAGMAQAKDSGTACLNVNGSKVCGPNAIRNLPASRLRTPQDEIKTVVVAKKDTVVTSDDVRKKNEDEDADVVSGGIGSRFE